MIVRRKSVWIVAALVVLLPCGVFLGFVVSMAKAASDYPYPTPSMEVGSYVELKEVLAGCEGMRFPDFAEYEAAPGASFRVSRSRRTGEPDGETYWLSVGGLADGRGGASGVTGVAFECRDLRQFDGHYTVAPEVHPDEEHAGVGLERKEYEGEANGGMRGDRSRLFIVGDYYYYYWVRVNYRIAAEEGEDAAQDIRDEADRETLRLACSVIDQ